MSDKESGCLAAAVVFFIGLPLSIAANALCVMLNWNWFAVPLGAPHLGLGGAAGVSVVVACFYTVTPEKRDPSKPVNDQVLWMFAKMAVRTATLCGFGWLLHAVTS